MKGMISKHNDGHSLFVTWLLNLSDRQLSIVMLLLAVMICTALMLVDRSFFG